MTVIAILGLSFYNTVIEKKGSAAIMCIFLVTATFTTSKKMCFYTDKGTLLNSLHIQQAITER